MENNETPTCEATQVAAANGVDAEIAEEDRDRVALAKPTRTTRASHWPTNGAKAIGQPMGLKPFANPWG